jgi:prepilin-type N-terminal cleavage/methylation domain-containing protein
MKTNQTGFSIVEILVAVVIIGLVGAVGWLVYDRLSKDKIEPVATQIKTQKESNETATPAKDPYEGMAKYTNDKYGISFYHAKDWKTEEVHIDASSGLIPTEFAINVKGNSTEKYAETASIEIHTKNLQETAKTYEDLYGQSTTAKVNKVTGTLKGEESVHLTITQPDGDKTEHYLFAVGSKTYSLRSINEPLNVERSQDYWSNFQKLYDSLQLK